MLMLRDGDADSNALPGKRIFLACTQILRRAVREPNPTEPNSRATMFTMHACLWPNVNVLL